MTRVNRRTVDLTEFPDLVVIYLGMRVQSLRGLRTLFSFGIRIDHAVREKPDGLLLHENIIYSFFPPHFGMRQYWRDFRALESWTRTLPHQAWWQEFLRDSGGTGFWHEAYFKRGGMEAIFDDVSRPVGFLNFAKTMPARGPMFGARGRVQRGGVAELTEAVTEAEAYGAEGD